MRQRLTIEQMQFEAEKHGGKCLSTKYVNNNTKLLWQCSKGHQWEAIPINIRNLGHWCPFCAGKSSSSKKSIQDMQNLASQYGGKCLSKKYIDLNHKLAWQCSFGHTWETTPNSIIAQKSWCPVCAKENIQVDIPKKFLRKISIEAARKKISKEKMVIEIIKNYFK